MSVGLGYAGGGGEGADTSVAAPSCASFGSSKDTSASISSSVSNCPASSISSSPFNFFTLLSVCDIFLFKFSVCEMNIQIQITDSDECFFLKFFCPSEGKLLTKDALRGSKGDPDGLRRCVLGDVDSLCVEFDFPEGTAVEQHRLMRQWKDRMRSGNRTAIAVDIGTEFRICVDVLKLSLTVDVGDVTARLDRNTAWFFVGLEFKMVACQTLFPFAGDPFLNRRFSERRRATKRKADRFCKRTARIFLRLSFCLIFL